MDVREEVYDARDVYAEISRISRKAMDTTAKQDDFAIAMVTVDADDNANYHILQKSDTMYLIDLASHLLATASIELKKDVSSVLTVVETITPMHIERIKKGVGFL